MPSANRELVRTANVAFAPDPALRVDTFWTRLNWIGGTLRVGGDSVAFAPNRVNALALKAQGLDPNHAKFEIPLVEVTQVHLRKRFGIVTVEVLGTFSGKRFGIRCRKAPEVVEMLRI